jgi:tyrosine-protein kinase Etk/Wzc
MRHDPHAHDFTPVQVLQPMPAPMPYGYALPPQPEGPPGLLSFVDNLLQHARLAGGVLLAALVAGVLYLVVTPPVWQSDALLQIDASGPRALATSLAQVQAGPQPPQGFVQGELEILRSREIVARAIQQTNADLDVAVDSRMPVIGAWWARRFAAGATKPVDAPLPGLEQWAWGGERLRVAQLVVPRARFGEPLWIEAVRDGWVLRDEDERALARGRLGEVVSFSLDGAPARVQIAEIAARDGTRFRLVPSDPGVVYDNTLMALKIEEAGRQSGVIRVSYADTDAAFAKSFVDALTAAYLDHHLKVRSSEASRALAFLEGQLPAVKQELDRAEEALDAYRTGNATIDVAQENENALRRISDLERQRVEIEMRQQQLAQRFTPNHPDVQALARQGATVAAAIGALRGQMRQAPRQEKDVVRLQRNVQVNTQLYTAMLNNAQELRVAQAGMTGNARLVDPAGVQSRPVKPRAGTVLAITAALGLIAALLAVLAARVLRPTLRTSEELEHETGIATLAAIPESPRQRTLMRGPRLWRARLQQRLLAVRSPSEPAVEGLRALRNSVTMRAERTLVDGAPRGSVALVTSSTSEAGKSFVAANLAVLMAAADRRVLLVDADLRAPRLHAYFGVDRDRPGLADVLDGRATLDDAILRDVLPGLDLLLTGHVTESPGELLLQPRFEKLLDALRASHSQVLIDSAPVLPVGDTLALGRLADATYVVVRSEANTQREVRDTIRRLESVGTRIDGLVLNGVKRGRLGNVPYRGYFMPDAELRGVATR